MKLSNAQREALDKIYINEQLVIAGFPRKYDSGYGGSISNATFDSLRNKGYVLRVSSLTPAGLSEISNSTKTFTEGFVETKRRDVLKQRYAEENQERVRVEIAVLMGDESFEFYLYHQIMMFEFSMHSRKYRVTRRYVNVGYEIQLDTSVSNAEELAKLTVLLDLLMKVKIILDREGAAAENWIQEALKAKA